MDEGFTREGRRRHRSSPSLDCSADGQPLLCVQGTFQQAGVILKSRHMHDVVSCKRNKFGNETNLS